MPYLAKGSGKWRSRVRDQVPAMATDKARFNAQWFPDLPVLADGNRGTVVKVEYPYLWVLLDSQNWGEEQRFSFSDVSRALREAISLNPDTDRKFWIDQDDRTQSFLFDLPR